jgi:superfamily II DNA or RNA helicase/very-short-patch-repair endonuclease
VGPGPDVVDNHSPPERKIALFRSLFRGREDVYAIRFESRRSNKAGYMPACGNEWVRGVCEKPRVKCGRCPNRRFLAVTDDVIRFHLEGGDDRGREFVVGVYPMLQDETSRFLVVDFDKAAWREDTLAFVDTCRRMNLPAAMERSRSGNGAHVWLFFEAPIPASLARRLASHVLTETMERRPDLGLDSYDRLIPNQDTLPKGGLGALIALPLQKKPRENGCAVFLDENLIPCPDQWAHLATIRRLPRAEVDATVQVAESKGRVVGIPIAPDEDDSTPWLRTPSGRRVDPPIGEPLPKELEIVLSDEVYLEKDGLPPALRNRLIRLAAFQNPEFHRAQAMRLPTYGKPRIVACAREYGRHIGLPRGCLPEVLELLAEMRVEAHVRDERFAGQTLDATFLGRLRPEQQLAAQALLESDTGVLAATTAFGKTVVAAWLIARRRTNTLVIVHRKQLLEQWVERLSGFLHLPQSAVGVVGGGRRAPTGGLDVAVMQSLVRKGVVDDLVAGYGQLIVDECHHIPAYSFEQVARKSKARFVVGLSATPVRKDGHHPIIFMQCGPVRYRVDARKQAAERPFEHVAIVRPTDFRPIRSPDPDARLQFQDLCNELMADERRNRLICEDIAGTVQEGRSPIVLTERKEHLEALASLLVGQVRHLIVLQGGMGRRALREARTQLSAIPLGEERVLLATGGYIGEGFDDARLDTLFLTLPISWRGTVAQYLGRLHRLHEGKREVRVYDYADLNVPMLERMFDRRCRGYEAAGYRILLPASAVPGWPAGVPLPVEPRWKSEYAASVRRLVRDGVEPPLADLFARATALESRPLGTGSARSASEAFLHRRLETLSETKGRFQLNAVLVIPFNGRGTMEVDFLCREAALVLEIDGDQHFDDAEAYRRDRRKDYLLQENGYLVLRFLAGDLGKRLDDVIDAILRALAHRSNATQGCSDAKPQK